MKEGYFGPVPRIACTILITSLLAMQIISFAAPTNLVNLYENKVQPLVPEAFAGAPDLPFVSDPITPARFEGDLSEFDPEEPASPEDPKDERDFPEEPGIGAPQGVSQTIGGQAQPFQQVAAALDGSWIAISNFITPKPQLASAQGVPFGTPIVNFDGIPATFVPQFGFVPYPPDTNGDVGLNHYIQTVNSEFAIFDKNGNTLAGPLFINTLFSALPAGDPCATFNDGDPIALYDHLADRWLISQFVAFTNQCIAISITGDPVAGGWYVYNFPTGGVVNDYPHFGLWPDAYYMGTNAGYPSGHAWAFDRVNMLSGNPATYQRFPGVGSLASYFSPSDLDGPAPPAGAPNIFMRIVDGAEFGGLDRLELRAFHVDFANPALSTFTALPDVATAPFDRDVCPPLDLMGICVPQPGTGQLLESLTAWTMYSLQYRNFGTHETLVVNHSVDVGAGQAGIRWYELRQVGAGAWSIFQQGDYSPDSTHRWMGSIAMDQEGDMSLGYSASSSSVYPSIRYTGRLPADAPGTMPQGENNIIAGLASQNFFRWGDYSAMRVDPTDDCTFWYTTEYFGGPSGTSNQWSTRIASFKFPECGEVIVGGELVSLDMVALLMAGTFANAGWIIPTLAGVAGAAILTIIGISRRKTS